MNTTYLSRLFIGVLVAIAVPGIACFGWYSTESAGATTAAVRTMVIVAYPVALIALTFLVLALVSPSRRRTQAWISAVSLVLALAIVLFART